MSQLKQRTIRLSLPIEGMIFLVIMGFVTICAVLRSVNMLVVVSGMMAAALLFSWRISRHAVRNVTVRRDVSARVHVGQLVQVRWPAVNQGSLNIYNLTITDSIRQVVSRLGAVDKTNRTKHTRTTGVIRFRKIAVLETVYSSYKLLFTERGIYEFGPSVVESRFPLALVRSWFRTQQIQKVYVAPQLGKLSTNWDRLFVSNDKASTSRAALHGIQEENFFAIREWQSGDNRRKIHWRSSAKNRQPMVKQYDRVSEQHRALVVDLFAEPRDAQEYLKSISLCEQALRFVATILSQWSDGAQGNLHIAINGQESVCYSSVYHVDFLRLTMQTLACAQPGEGHGFKKNVETLHEYMSQDTIGLVVSTRNWEDVPDETRVEMPLHFRWLNVDSREFGGLFRCPEKLEAIGDVEG